MEKVSLRLGEDNKGEFYIAKGEKELGEMTIGIKGSTMTVYHTGVVPEAEGQGLAKMMLEAMVAYARENSLKVVPLCSYVHAQFKRNPDMYADIWNPDAPEGKTK